MSLRRRVLLIKTADFKCCFFPLKNCNGKSAFLCFVLYFFLTFSFCILRKKGPLFFLFNARFFPHSSIICHLLKFFILQLSKPSGLSVLALIPPALHVFGATLECRAGRRLQTTATSAKLPSFMREILAKLHILEVHSRQPSILLKSICHMSCQILCFRNTRSSLQKLQQPKTRKEPYKKQSSRLTTCSDHRVSTKGE